MRIAEEQIRETLSETEFEISAELEYMEILTDNKNPINSYEHISA